MNEMQWTEQGAAPNRFPAELMTLMTILIPTQKRSALSGQRLVC